MRFPTCKEDAEGSTPAYIVVGEVTCCLSLSLGISQPSAHRLIQTYLVIAATNPRSSSSCSTVALGARDDDLRRTRWAPLLGIPSLIKIICDTVGKVGKRSRKTTKRTKQSKDEESEKARKCNLPRHDSCCRTTVAIEMLKSIQIICILPSSAGPPAYAYCSIELGQFHDGRFFLLLYTLLMGTV